MHACMHMPPHPGHSCASLPLMASPMQLSLLLFFSLLLSSLPSLTSSHPTAHPKAKDTPLLPAIAPNTQAFHVTRPRTHRSDAAMAKNGKKRGLRRRRKRENKSTAGGDFSERAFSAMLPRGFVPPSGSSACHNDMPDSVDDVRFFVCGGGASP